MKKKIFRKLNTKLMLLFASFAVLMGVFISVFSYRITWNQATSFYSEKARQAATLAAGHVDGDRVARYLETMETDEAYEDMEAALTGIKRSMGLSYLYVFIPGGDSFTYIVDIQLEDEDPDYFSDLGDIFEYTEAEYKNLLPDVEARQASQKVIVATSSLFFGTAVTSWAPVLNSAGEVAAMVEADITLDQVAASIRNALTVMLGVYLSMILLMIAFQSVVLRQMITLPLQKLTERTLQFASGEELSEFVDDIKTGDELQTLSESFGKMAQDITVYTQEKSAMAANQERIATELHVATGIQQSMLPCIFPAFPEREEFDIYATMDPAKEVGGDFYDFFMVDDRHLAIVAADVSGKGVPAALFMVIGKTLIKDHTLPGSDLGEVFTRVNDLLCESNREGLFITAFEGVLDLVTGEFNFVNAGHEMPFICRVKENYAVHKIKPGFVLAGMEGMHYRAGSTTLAPGDRIFQYTDGVTEATNADNTLYGMERLERVLNANRDKTPAELLPAVKADIDRFVGDAPQFDDITMLCLEYKCRMEAENERDDH